jgi:hypothetical protein
MCCVRGYADASEGEIRRVGSSIHWLQSLTLLIGQILFLFNHP